MALFDGCINKKITYMSLKNQMQVPKALQVIVYFYLFSFGNFESYIFHHHIQPFTVLSGVIVELHNSFLWPVLQIVKW